MAALAGDIVSFPWRGLGPRQTNPFPIANAAQLYVGALLELTSGFAAAYASTGGATNPVLGIAVGGGIPGSNPVLDGYNLASFPIPMIAPGNASSAAVGNANQVIVEQGAFTWMQATLALTTIVGSQADVGTKVFAVTSNINDCVVANPGSDKVFGVITAFYSKPTATTGVYDIFVNSFDARTRAN